VSNSVRWTAVCRCYQEGPIWRPVTGRGKSGRVRELCLKLKPIIGDQADRCWLAYVAEDDDGKEQIEQYLELVAPSTCAAHLSTMNRP
jgi:hypothetical protein